MSDIVRSASVPFARIVGFPGGPGPKGDVGPAGPKGDRGDQGPAGVPGTATINGFDVNNTSRRVCATAVGSAATVAAPQWAKIATVSLPANSDCTLVLAVGAAAAGATESGCSAIVALGFHRPQTSSPHQANVNIVSHSVSTNMILPDSFKVISGAWGTDFELWVKKGRNNGAWYFYQIALASLNPVVINYNNNAAWQTVEPVGAELNVSSAGVTAFGRPVGTRVSVPALPSSAGLAGQWAADDTNFYVYGASGWRRAALQTWTVANKVSEEDEEG